MKAAAKTVFIYVAMLSLIGIIISTVLSFIGLIFALVNVVMQGYRSILGALIKALILLAFIIMMLAALKLFGVAATGVFGFAKAGFGAGKALVGKGGSALREVSQGRGMDLYRRIGQSYDGRKLNQLGGWLNKRGFKGIGRQVKRVGYAVGGANQLAGITRHGSDGKVTDRFLEKDENGKTRINTDALKIDTTRDPLRNGNNDNELSIVQSDMTSQEVSNIATRNGGVAFDEVRDGMTVSSIVAENLLLPNGLSVDEVVDATEAYNGETRRHLEEAGEELGAFDRQAKDTAEEFRESHQEIQDARKAAPVAGHDIQDIQQNVSRTSTEILNATLLSSSAGISPLANIADDKVPYYASNADGLPIDSRIASAQAAQMAEHQRTLAAGQAGFPAGSTSQNAINAAAAQGELSSLEHMGDTMHNAPMRGIIPNQDLIDAEMVDDDFIRSATQDEFNRYHQGMNNPGIIDVTEYEKDIDITNITAANSAQTLGTVNNDQVTGETAQNAQPVNQTGQTVIVDQTATNENSSSGNNAEVSNDDVMRAMENGMARQADTILRGMAGVMGTNMLAGVINDNDKISLSDETLMRMQRIQENVAKNTAKNNKSNHSEPIDSIGNTTNTITNTTNNSTINVNNDIKAAASSYADDYKKANPEASEADVSRITDQIRSQIENAVKSASERGIREAEEQEKSIGLERLKDGKNDGKLG